MPYIIKTRHLKGLLGVATAALLTGAAPAMASAMECQAQPFSQPFTSVNDTSNYVLVPGESAGAFDGSGWELSGGARVVQAPLSGGGTASVLDLPGGSKAVSPTFCVTTEYPTARAVARNVKGPQGVGFGVSYEGTPSWKAPRNTGQMHGAKPSEWTVSAPVNMQPENVLGWQHVRITLTAGGPGSENELYDLYVDP